ncbi:MAG: hypothetical protein J5626_00875 [Lachnospiraceae bacterium]|nr:hypothetical protein [Lachnospiraceae bacterium]
MLRRLLSWVSESRNDYYENMTIRDDDEETQVITKQEHKEDIKRVKEKVYGENGGGIFRKYRLLYTFLAVVFAIFFSTVLLLTVSELPKTGELDNPANNEVERRYVEKGLEETGATNIVAGMILDYRAFDTLGESHVLFVAAITVTILLRLDKKERDPEDTKITETIGEAEEEDKIFEPHHDAILQKVAMLLVPIIILFGIYVILNGHLSPGGGFSGGAIIGAGLILYLNAFGFEKTEKFFNEKVYKTVIFSGLAFYALAKCYAFFCGANHLDSHISKGIAGHIISAGLILPLDIAVGCVVACTMYAFYAMFRKGGL